MTKKERFKHFLDYFSSHHPVAETELNYSTPYELLVAVILSAQCTDKRVNLLTPVFFKRFPSEEHLAMAGQKEVLSYINSCSFPNNKTKHLIGMARMLHEEYNGEVPSDINELQKLPGVGRKTANVIASVVYNKPALAVDTHVFRVSKRIGLTTNPKNPLDAEQQLVRYIPEKKLPIAHHWLILHGRYICTARSPKCDECPISFFCKYYQQSGQGADGKQKK